MFRWIENELVPPDVLHSLDALTPLTKGRIPAREAEPVRPVPLEHVEAVFQEFLEPKGNTDAHVTTAVGRLQAAFTRSSPSNSLDTQTITSTMDRYSHVRLLDMNSALESLPTILSPESQAMRATGAMDDAADFSCTKSCARPSFTPGDRSST